MFANKGHVRLYFYASTHLELVDLRHLTQRAQCWGIQVIGDANYRTCQRRQALAPFFASLPALLDGSSTLPFSALPLLLVTCVVPSVQASKKDASKCLTHHRMGIHHEHELACHLTKCIRHFYYVSPFQSLFP